MNAKLTKKKPDHQKLSSINEICVSFLWCLCNEKLYGNKGKQIGRKPDF